MKKLVIVAVVSVALLIAGYLVYRYFFYTCCAIPPKEKTGSSAGTEDSKLNDPNLLFASRTWAGLCTNKEGEGGSCYDNTYLYSSGELITESGWSDGGKSITYPTIQKKLGKNLMDQIMRQIRDSGIMKKDCPAELVTDYNTTTFINLDNIKREIEFPGCESELKKIDKLIE